MGPANRSAFHTWDAADRHCLASRDEARRPPLPINYLNCDERYECLKEAAVEDEGEVVRLLPPWNVRKASRRYSRRRSEDSRVLIFLVDAEESLFDDR